MRDAVVTDASRIAELLAMGAVVPGHADPAELLGIADAIAEIAATAAGAVLVAEIGGLVVGVCQLITFRHVQQGGGRCAEIESMYVDPALRSRGVGALLVAAAIARARSLGCYRIQLTSNKHRTDAHRFYERCGFVASHEGFKLLL